MSDTSRYVDETIMDDEPHVKRFGIKSLKHLSRDRRPFPRDEDYRFSKHGKNTRHRLKKKIDRLAFNEEVSLYDEVE